MLLNQNNPFFIKRYKCHKHLRVSAYRRCVYFYGQILSDVCEPRVLLTVDIIVSEIKNAEKGFRV